MKYTKQEIDLASESKQSIRHSKWISVATFGSTFPDGDGGDGTGACDVWVQIGESDGNWYLRTQDDAGGSDDCDATPFSCRAAAEAAAKEYAKNRDECDGLSAEKWLEMVSAENE